MTPLNVVILCGQSARHLHVANRICDAANVLAIVHESGRPLDMEKIRRLANPRRFSQKAWRWLRDRRRYTGNPEAAYFFNGANPTLNSPELVRHFPDVNDPGVVTLVDELQPDLIVVFGTSLIRGPLLERGKLGIVNLHGGLSPHYRGADCTFWALFNGEPEQVGCTIHYINAGIDTGELIAHISPPVHSDDTELLLFWRAVEESGKVYAELMRRMAAGDRFGQAQHEKGKLYQVKDRGYRHERQLERALSNGLLEGVELPLRVKWFEKSEN